METTATQTTVNSNGSKWAGESPDSIETLLDVLTKETLDRTFELYGNFVLAPEVEGDDMVRFWGNFATVSHVFSIDTNDPEMIETLTKAIRANQKTAAYKAQPKPSKKPRGTR